MGIQPLKYDKKAPVALLLSFKAQDSSVKTRPNGCLEWFSITIFPYTYMGCMSALSVGYDTNESKK